MNIATAMKGITQMNKSTIDMAREIAAQYIKAERFQTWTHDYMMERLMELVSVSVATEREACAKVCEDDALSSQYGERSKYRALLATAIRARENT